MAQVTMRLRLPRNDLTALDRLCDRGNRSEYVREVLAEYLKDKEKILAVFNSTLGEFYGQKERGNEYHNPGPNP